MDKDIVPSLERLFLERWQSMRISSKTDRRNLSAKWNRYLGNYGAEVLHNFRGRRTKESDAHVRHAFMNLVEIINRRNDRVAGSVVIKNPDRAGQFIILPRDMGERILVLGML